MLVFKPCLIEAHKNQIFVFKFVFFFSEYLAFGSMEQTSYIYMCRDSSEHDDAVTRLRSGKALEKIATANSPKTIRTFNQELRSKIRFVLPGVVELLLSRWG